MSSLKTNKIFIKMGLMSYSLIQISYDSLNNIIHVFDDYEKGATTVTNSIELIQDKILKLLGLEGHPNQFRWFLYATDGYISELERKTLFRNVDIDSQYIAKNKSWLSEMKARRTQKYDGVCRENKIAVIEIKKDFLKINFIKQTLSSFQHVVNGLIEVVNVGGPFILVCDEEGKLRRKETTLILKTLDRVDHIAGTCFFAKREGEEIVGLSEKDIKIIINRLTVEPNGLYLLDINLQSLVNFPNN